MEIFDEEALVDMGDLIGRIVKVVPISVEVYRGRYARVCMEIDLNKLLLPSISVFYEPQLVEYEGLHLICFSCGKYRHRSEACNTLHQTEDQSEPPMAPTLDRPYGPWMLPKNPWRRKEGKRLEQWEVPELSTRRQEGIALKEPSLGPLVVQGSEGEHEPTPQSTHPKSQSPSSSRFAALEGLTEDETSLETMVAQLKKKISEIPGPSIKAPNGSVHARGEGGSLRGGKAPSQGSKSKPGLPSNLQRKPGQPKTANHIALQDVSNSFHSSPSGKAAQPQPITRNLQKRKDPVVATSPPQ